VGLTPGSDYEAGNLCPDCFNLDMASIKGPGWLITPKYVKVTISGVIACPGNFGDPNGSYLLTQVFPCFWTFLDATWQIRFNIHYTPHPNPYSLLQAIYVSDGKEYFSGVGPDCGTEMSNSFVIGDCGALVGGHSGSGLIRWGPGITP